MSSITKEAQNKLYPNHSLSFGQMGAAKKIFVGWLALNGLMQLAIGMMMLIDFEQAATAMFGIMYTPDMAILGVTLGTNVLFSGIIAALSVVWVFKGNPKGISLGMLFGWLAITAGIAAFVLLGRLDGLIVDVTRGSLILLTGYLAQR